MTFRARTLLGGAFAGDDRRQVPEVFRKYCFGGVARASMRRALKAIALASGLCEPVLDAVRE